MSVYFLSYSDKSLPEDQRERLISDIEAKLNQKPSKSFGNPMRRFNGMVNEIIVSNGMTPTPEYELLRRRVGSNILEMYNYVGSELTKIWKNNPIVPELGDYVNKVIQMTTEHKRSLVNDMEHLQKIDGYEQWRRNEAESLSDLVQRRLKHLQNPKDCSTARKLICRLNKVSLFNLLCLTFITFLSFSLLIQYFLSSDRVAVMDVNCIMSFIVLLWHTLQSVR